MHRRCPTTPPRSPRLGSAAAAVGGSPPQLRAARANVTYSLFRRQICGSPSADRAQLGFNQSTVERLERTATLAGHRGCVNTVTFTPDGSLLMTGSDDCRIMLWDARTHERRAVTPTAHTGNIFCVRALPCSGNRTLVSCAADGKVCVNTLRQGAAALDVDRDCRTLRRHRGRAHKLAVEPGSPHVFFSTGEDGKIFLCG